MNLNAKCIIDDNSGCHGKFLRGVPIVGGRNKIIDAVGEYGIDEIILQSLLPVRVLEKKY